MLLDLTNYFPKRYDYEILLLLNVSAASDTGNHKLQYLGKYDYSYRIIPHIIDRTSSINQYPDF